MSKQFEIKLDVNLITKAVKSAIVFKRAIEDAVKSYAVKKIFIDNGCKYK